MQTLAVTQRLEQLSLLISGLEGDGRVRALELCAELKRDLSPQQQQENSQQAASAIDLGPKSATPSTYRIITVEAEEEFLKYDVFSLGVNGSKWISLCTVWLAIGYYAPSLLSARRILLLGRTIFFMGHVLAWCLYRRVIWRVNESYTSYRGGNDYGYTNVEKAEIRAEVTRVWRLLLFRAIVVGLVHYNFLLWVTPLLITSTLGYGTLLNNPHYVDVFFNPNKLKKPQGFIPRSHSGRLL